MNRLSRSLFLEETIRVLVLHFGVEAVRAALAKVSIGCAGETKKSSTKSVPRGDKPARPTIANALELIRESSPQKHRLLIQFARELDNRKILPESQDIRYFAQLVGLKEIEGKSRKDLLPILMRFLIDQPITQLRTDIRRADNISEQQRQLGFSVLTDKLLGEK